SAYRSSRRLKIGLGYLMRRVLLHVDSPMASIDNSQQIDRTGETLMFRKNKSVSEEFNGFLADGTSMTGDLQFSGTLHLNGNFRGSISTADVLIIGEKA